MDRGIRVLRFLVAIAWMGVLAAPALASDLPLMPDNGQETRTLDLGASRDAATLTIRFLAATKLSATPEAALSDAQTVDGRKLDATLTPVVKLEQGARTAAVVVTVKPGKHATAGSYDTQLLLRGPGVTDARSKLTIKLADTSVGGAGLWATILLALGAALGLIAKWLAGTASALRGIEERLRTVEALISGFEPLPVVFRTNLVQVRTQLASENASAADATLKTNVEGAKATAAVDVAEKAHAIGRKIAEQSNAIARLPNLDPVAAGKLDQVLAIEHSWVDAMVQATDYDADAQATERAGRVNDAQRFSAFLPYYRDESQRPNFEPAIQAFVTGDFADAETKWRGAAGASAVSQEALGALPAVPPPAVTSATAPSGGKFTQWLIRHAPLLAQGFTAVGLVIVGLFTVYDPSKTFRGNDTYLDAVALFAWGLGSALAGGGISEITGKLTAGRSGST